jgi:predicted nucleic acid-binding protein
MYLDSCIIIKLLTPEADSVYFDEALSGQPLTSSELAYTEVNAALQAKERAGRISAGQRKQAWRQFQQWIQDEDIVLESLNSTVLRKACQVLERCHPKIALRTLDALHVATADLCQDLPLCSTDMQLRQAAVELGLEVFPPA